MDMKYCAACTSEIIWGIPPGDTTERHFCPDCGHVNYDNPIPVVLTLLHTSDRVLLIRRAVPPYTGTWAPPGGYVDHRETIDAAAVREMKEETGIEIEPNSLVPYSIVSIPAINQICFICRSRVDNIVKPRLGSETSQAEWFTKKEMPFDEYFLPNHADGLETFFDCLKSGNFRIYMAEASFSEGVNRSVRVAPLAESRLVGVREKIDICKTKDHS